MSASSLPNLVKVNLTAVKRSALLGVAFSIVSYLFTPQAAQAQYMVCQTPTFWCAVPGRAPNGYPCWCNTAFGPVGGQAIDPTPYIQSQNPDRGDEDEEINLESDAQDCLNGLGECKGTFKSAVKKKRNRRN